ncbi:MAG TPA: hypothetical protein VMS09_07305 [Paenibacillus sp.]|uniref:hypothetical protein n=1 Tax=Paenibacillus sp. TaxID=58172 RepID=UPI002C14FE0D|nr:hypothetical protein [Paenibacillus sp.]HUC91818.1 hypothetical protein [Paenibacillus sp.]
MNNKEWKGSEERYAAERAALLERLEADPDLVFEQRIAVEVEPAHADFWLTFAAEWGGALHMLDETNAKRFELGTIDESQYEYARRSYRLGQIVLSELYDRLKASSEHGGGAQSFRLPFGMLDCYFVPAYLHDFGQARPDLKPLCKAYIEKVRQALTDNGGAPLEETVRLLDETVGTYIRELRRFASRGRQ